MRTTVVWSLAVLVASISAGAAGYELGLQRSRISSAVQYFKAAASGPCPAGTTSPDPLATSPAGAALMARLLPRPSGAMPDGTFKQGVLSLKDYMSLLYASYPPEQQFLTALCFQTAADRAWVAPDGTITSIFLIQFASAADARSYVLGTQQADARDPAITDVFRVPHVADGMGLGQPKLDKYGNTRTRLLGDAGNVAIVVHFFVPARTDNAAAARILQRQSAMLTSGSS